jgi:hypothetical protein
MGTASFCRIQDHPFRPNIKLNPTFLQKKCNVLLKMLQIITPTALKKMSTNPDPDPYRHPNGKSDPDADRQQKQCRSKIHNAVFPVNMVSGWLQKSGNFIWWQWNSLFYLFFDCFFHANNILNDIF